MFAKVKTLFQETIKEWLEDGAASIAAALAYYTIFSLSPLLILVALLIGSVLSEQVVTDDLFTDIEATVGEEAANTIRDMLSGQEDRPEGSNFLGTVVWFSVVLWGASGLFAQLQNALNKIWEVKAMPGRSPLVFFKNRFLSFSVVILAGFLTVTTMLINTGLTIAIQNVQAIADIAFIVRPLQLIVTMFMITVMFAMIFKILPDVIIAWKDVWVGAAFTAFLFLLGQFGVGLYLSQSDVGSVFGAAGSLTIILVWIYYSAQIMLFGAEFTEVWARHHGASIRPDGDAVWINEAQARREAEAAGVEFFEREPVTES